MRSDIIILESALSGKIKITLELVVNIILNYQNVKN